MLWSPLFPHAYNPTDMDFGPIAFDNESGSGFGLEMEKSNCGAKNLRLNTIRKRIGTVVFNISLNLLRNKNKKRKNIAFELSLVVASQLITITYCFLNHRHFREPSPHPLKSLCPLSYSNNSNGEPITKKPQSKIK
ncbi:hypothetical protein V6Z12_A01G159000 [Gossypium hirsutum]